MESVICVILAGGQSRRMGRDKAALPLGRETFLSRLIGAYGPYFPVYVSLGQPGKFPHPGAGELVDRRPGEGPLAGLETAFLETEAELVFLTATDLPFGAPALARTLLERIGDRDACLIRRWNGKPEPAFGIYRRTCLEPVQALLDQGRRAMQGLYGRVRVEWVEEAALPDFDLTRLLWNINTPEDYEKAEKLL